MLVDRLRALAENGQLVVGSRYAAAALVAAAPTIVADIFVDAEGHASRRSRLCTCSNCSDCVAQQDVCPAVSVCKALMSRVPAKRHSWVAAVGQHAARWAHVVA